MRNSLIALSLLVSAGACGDDSPATDAGSTTTDAAIPDAAIPDADPPDADPPDAGIPLCVGPIDPGADHTQYVADALLMPTTASQANQYGINLDGDPQNRPDNALGAILATLSSQGDLDIQGSLDALVDGGELLYLFDVSAADLANTVGADVLYVLGTDCDVPPNGTDNFSGDEPFIVADPSNEANLSGDIASSMLDIGPGEMILRIPVLTGDPIDLPLIGARIEGVIDANGITNARLGGAVRDADVQNSVIPALAVSLQATVDTDCPNSPPTCCIDGTLGQTYLDLFDENADCEITAVELQQNSLISSLLAPDVDLLDSNNGDVFDPRVDGIKDSLSIGIGFTAVGAQFERPTPMP